MNYSQSVALSFYLARRYLFWILITLGGLLAFVLLIDAVELYRRFNNAASDETVFTLIWILVLGIPEKLDILLPFGILFGSMLCFNSWNKTNELLAARSFGQNIWQALLPVFATVITIGLIQIFVLNPIKAATVDSQTSLKIDIFGNPSTTRLSVSTSGVWLKDASDGKDLIIHGPSLDLATNSINNPIIYGLNGIGGVAWRIRADLIRLDENGWVIEGALQSDSLGKTKELGNITMPTTITPSDFARTTQSPETISIYSLPSFIDMLNRTGLPSNEHQVYFQQQLSIPLKLLGLATLAVCFTLLGFTRMPRYKLIVVGIVAGFTIYFLTDLIYLLGANARLPIYVAGWAPAFTILFISGYIIARSEDR